MKKFIIILVIIGLLASLAYVFLWAPNERLKAIHLIPKDAAFVVTSSTPLASWKEFSNSKMWQHLKQSAELSILTEEANYLDSLIKENDWLDLFNDRELLISVHTKNNQNNYLYYVDLGKSASISVFDNYLQSLLGEDYRISKRQIDGVAVTELYFKADKETLYFAFIKNVLVASYDPQLIALVIQEAAEQHFNHTLLEVYDLAGDDGLFRLFVNYDKVSEYLSSYIDIGGSLDWLSTAFNYSALNISLKEQTGELSGYTNFIEKANPYVKALNEAGMAEHQFMNVLPSESPYFISLGFKSMLNFVEELEAALQSDTITYANYKAEKQSIEKFLDMDLKEQFFSWMGREMVFFQHSITNNSGKNQLAFMVEIADKDKAQKAMLHMQEQIKKKTPVKIQSLNYKGYSINYLAMKGLFKPFFGRLFADIDKPYYVILDDWLIFSSHPQSLKQIINTYLDGDVLMNNVSFNKHYQSLSEKSAAFCYLSLPNVFNQLQSISNAVQAKNIKNNALYIKSFTHISFQLLQDEKTFKTALKWQYDPYTSSESQPSKIIALHNNSNKKVDIPTYIDDLNKIDQIIIEDLSEKHFEIFYADGSVKYEFRIRDGWKDGSFESYYENGETQYKGKYKDDLKDGTWKLYNKEGQLIKKLKFEEGVLLEEN